MKNWLCYKFFIQKQESIFCALHSGRNIKNLGRRVDSISPFKSGPFAVGEFFAALVNKSGGLSAKGGRNGFGLAEER
jgi:hypothetical protein